MISKTNLKYIYAYLIPILLEIFPMAIAAMHLISESGSQSATFKPVVMILRYGRRSYELEMSSTMLPMTWQAPALSSETRPRMQ